MRRSTALALVASFVLAGFTPWLQALSGAQPHACCLRRLRARTDPERQLSPPPARHGNCCPPLTTPQVAVFEPAQSGSPLPATAATTSGQTIPSPTAFAGVGFSDRAPPAWHQPKNSELET